MTRRSRVISAQAAAVAILILIAYFTLLQPDGPGPLSGIEGPGNGAQKVAKPDGEGNGADGNGGAAGGPRAGAGGAAGDGGGGGATLAARFGPPTRKTGGPGPDDDQYQDTVRSLRSKLGIGPEIPR